MAKTDPALAVADHDQRRKAEALAALDRLGNAVDVDQLLDQLLAAVLVAATAAPTLAVTPPASAAISAPVAAAAATPAAAATATATIALLAALRGSGNGLDFDCRGRDFGSGVFGFVSHHQNSNPPSRAASASALTRP